MNKYIKFNVNGYTKVKLTNNGLKIIENYWGGRIPEWYNNYVDADGYYSFQMHELMNIFGENMTIGFNPPFETDILIEVDDE